MNLLRLGDILMMAPVLRGIKKKYPNAELHLLINKQFSMLEDMLPYVDEFKYFDPTKVLDNRECGLHA